MSGGSTPDYNYEEEDDYEEPDILFGTEDTDKHKAASTGTKSLQVPLTNTTDSGLGIPS